MEMPYQNIYMLAYQQNQRRLMYQSIVRTTEHPLLKWERSSEAEDKMEERHPRNGIELGQKSIFQAILPPADNPF